MAYFINVLNGLKRFNKKRNGSKDNKKDPQDCNPKGTKKNKLKLIIPHTGGKSNENQTSNFIKKHFDVINLNVKGSRELTWKGKSMSEKEFAIDLRIQYSPTILFLDKDKNVVLKLNGYRTPESFKTILEYIDGKHYKTKTLSEYLEIVKNKSLKSESDID